MGRACLRRRIQIKLKLKLKLILKRKWHQPKSRYETGYQPVSVLHSGHGHNRPAISDLLHLRTVHERSRLINQQRRWRCLKETEGELGTGKSYR